MTLRVYSGAGLLLRTADGGFSAQVVQAFQFSRNPFDPSQGPLIVSSGSWQMAFDGKSDQAESLFNGEYLVVVSSDDGFGAASSQQLLFVVGSQAAGLDSLVAGPNPAAGGATTVMISWLPATAVVLAIYTLNGELVLAPRQVALPPLAWDLSTASGGRVGNGIYLVQIRLPGQRTPLIRKLVVAR